MNNKFVQFRLDNELSQDLEYLAKCKGKNKSQVIRDLIKNEVVLIKRLAGDNHHYKIFYKNGDCKDYMTCDLTMMVHVAEEHGEILCIIKIN